MLLRNIIGRVLRESVPSDGGDAGGGAPQAVQQPAAKPSLHERFKAFLSPSADEGSIKQPEQETAEAPQARVQPKEPQQKPQRQQEQAAEPDDDAEGDEEASGDEIDFTSVAELAERTGLTVDRILDLSVSGKVGDKETKASIREMLKSYQTGELLNTKLQTHAAEVQAWKTQQAQEQQAYQQQLQRMDAGLQVAQRLLQGEFSSVNWDQLQQSDPNQFAQTLLGFQQRQAMLSQIADQLGKERQSQQQQQAEKHNAWLTEQKQMLEAKLPGWGEKATRDSAIKEFADVAGKAFGFSADEIGKLTDHRDFLVLDAATKWLKLQASKAPVMNKVRQAPKILRPGSVQSKSAQQGMALNEVKAKLRRSGNVRDLAKGLRTIGIV